MTNTNYRIIVKKKGYFKFGIKENINKYYKYEGANYDCFENCNTLINYMEKNKIAGFIVSDGGYIVYVKKYADKKGIKI